MANPPTTKTMAVVIHSGSPGDTARTALKPATAAMPKIITLRRSVLSDAQPIGHCRIRAPSCKAELRIAAPATPRPTSTA